MRHPAAVLARVRPGRSAMARVVRMLRISFRLISAAGSATSFLTRSQLCTRHPTRRVRVSVARTAPQLMGALPPVI
jgi:histidine ammonia-lyase